MSLGDDSAASKVCKITLLQQLVYRGNYDVLCETWLNNFVMDCELLYGYFLFQRTHVLVAIKTDLKAFCHLNLERERTLN